MSLSVIKWPQGIIKGTSSIGTYINGSSVISINATDYAALSTGETIYITNNQAIGFWYITKIAAGQIDIREYFGATAYTFVGSGTFTFYFRQFTHNWNAVHLPIIYKLKSTFWPINSADTIRTVSSYANDNGYVKLTLSGSLKNDATELEFLNITGLGVYQIIAWYSNSILTINLAYSGSAMTFGTVQYYYNNYHARIRVYAGLKSTHTYALQKPYALITEQEVIPDSTGVITFNINEFLKQQIGILKNDMLAGTLPNNLDAWCMFYITYAEAYDYSAGGYTLLDFVDLYTDDSGNFEGFAINADLPFKNTYSCFMSDYIYGGNSATVEKFLTPTLYPEITGTNYFDISYIIDKTFDTSNVFLVQRTSLNNVGIQTIYNVIGSGTSNYGVYRFSISKQNTEDTQKIFLATKGFLLAPTSWSDGAHAFGLKTATQFIKSAAVLGTVYSAYQPVNIIGETPQNITFTVGPTGGGILNVEFAFYDTIGGTKLSSNSINTSGSTPTFTFSIITSQANFLQISATNIFGSVDITITLTPGQFIGGVTTIYSETKTISVNNGFFNSGSTPYTNYNIGWLNYLGGFDWKVFQSGVDFGVNIEGTKTVNKNIFQNWPNSFGEGADTIKQETSRSTRGTMTFRAENLTSDQVNDLFRLKTSPLVQIVNAANDRRTIIPDKSSFIYYKQTEKLFSFEFTADLTDNLPSQSL